MKKTDYLLFAGPTKDKLNPVCTYRYKEDAIAAAKRLEAEKIKKMKCMEIVLMLEDDDETNKVVWKNYN